MILADPALARWLRSLAPRSRRRAALSKLAHDITSEHVENLYRRQQGRCAVSGLPFSLDRLNDVLVKHPFAPSLDRVSSRGGYTSDNTRLVCVAVNFGMGQWGQELYLTFARAAVAYSNEEASSSMATGGLLTLGPTPEFSTIDTDWSLRQRERIAAAEAVADALPPGEALVRQRRHIASLKRNLTLGPGGLRAAAEKAARKLRAKDLTDVDP